jgi:hypothetical protein
VLTEMTFRTSASTELLRVAAAMFTGKLKTPSYIETESESILALIKKARGIGVEAGLTIEQAIELIKAKKKEDE